MFQLGINWKYEGDLSIGGGPQLLACIRVCHSKETALALSLKCYVNETATKYSETLEIICLKIVC